MSTNSVDNKGDYFMFYPVYVNYDRSVNKGRKYSKDMSITIPKIQEIRKALETLKYDFKYEPNKKHPKDKETAGRFTIKKITSRLEQIQQIIHSIKEARKMQKEAENKSKVQNTLNLKPKKKSKGKK